MKAGRPASGSFGSVYELAWVTRGLAGSGGVPGSGRRPTPGSATTIVGGPNGPRGPYVAATAEAPMAFEVRPIISTLGLSPAGSLIRWIDVERSMDTYASPLAAMETETGRERSGCSGSTVISISSAASKRPVAGFQCARQTELLGEEPSGMRAISSPL